MKMYAFSCGTLTCDKSLITFGRDVGKKFTVPVPFYLIQHPRGNVLFDLGNAKEVARDAKKHWGVIADFYVPDMKEDDYVVNKLKTIGVKPEDIKYIVMSHLHLDHAGVLGTFRMQNISCRKMNSIGHILVISIRRLLIFVLILISRFSGCNWMVIMMTVSISLGMGN